MKTSLSVSLKFAVSAALAISINASAIASERNGNRTSSDDVSPASAPSAVTAPQASGATEISPEAASQITALDRDKSQRTPAQQKIGSNLIYAARMAAGKDAAPGVRTLNTGVVVRPDRKVLVDIRARISSEVLEAVKSVGGEIVASYPETKAIFAYVPLANLESLASDERVLAIRSPKIPTLEHSTAPSSKAERHERIIGQLYAALQVPSNLLRESPGARAAERPEINATTVGGIRGAVPEGDIRHRARAARLTYGIDGTGLKVGVLSDSFNALGGYSTDVATGDLPGPGNPNGYTLPVLLAGSGDYLHADATDEGRAMTQIIHAILPGAQIYFATAFNNDADFANNIRALRGIAANPGASGNVPNGGCDIIVDDVSYSQEASLRDGATEAVDSASGMAVIKQAVNDVVATNALYFSSAANSGNKNDNTSGTWEGDFVDAGPATSPVPIGGGNHVHNWNSGGTASMTNNITAAGSYLALEWSDPLGTSSNDYDLYLLNAAGTAVVGASTDIQNGTNADPTEAIYPGQGNSLTGISAGLKAVVVQKPGAQTRFLSVNTGRAQFQFSTNGQTRGHATAPGSFGVAAVPTSTSVGPTFPAPFGPANMVETFSSDGPRRVFFDENNFAYNSFTLASGGGIVRQKPDVAAADGAPNTVPGFERFFGTSAAAPHAAGIAGLVKLGLLKAGVGHPRVTRVRTALTTTGTDIETPGVDQDAGYGVLDAFKAVQSTGAPGGAALDTGTIVGTETSNSNGNGRLDPGETINVTIPLTNVGINTASNVSATLSTTTPGVTILSSDRTYGDIAPGATASPTVPYSMALDSSFPCSSDITFKLVVNYVGAAAGVTPQTFLFKLGTGLTGIPQFFTVLDTTPPPTNALYTATTGTQTGRLLGTGVAQSCGNPKAAPPLSGNQPSAQRRYDAYTFMNGGAARCVTVTYNPPQANAAGSNFVGCAAYTVFDPANPQSGYLGDAGSNYTSNPGGFADVSYSFTAPANAPFTVVVFESNPGATASSLPSSGTYGLRISGLAICDSYSGSSQQDVTEVAPVVIQTSQFGPPSCAAQGYSNNINITATVKNNSSATLNNVVFQVAVLTNASGSPASPPYRLLTATGADCTQGGLVGSTQPGPSSLAPGQTANIVFTIAAPSTARYRFGVRTLASTGSAMNGSPSKTERARLAQAKRSQQLRANAPGKPKPVAVKTASLATNNGAKRE